MTTHEDWDMWIRMSRLFQFAHLKKVTCEFAWRQDGSTMSSSKKEDFIRTARMIYEKHRHLAADKPAVLEGQRKGLAAREPAGEEKERQRQVPRQGAAVQPEPAASAGNENDLIARRLEQADKLVKEGKLSKALAGYQAILGIDANNHRAMTGIGVIRLLEGKRDEAGISFDRALRRTPDDPKALCGAGMVEVMKGRDGAAFDCFSRALDSDPENLTALGELIKCAYRHERFTEAEHYLENYLRYHPADLDMLFSQAGIQFRVGKYAEAMDNIEKLLIFAPEYDGGQELKEKIGAMPGLNQAPAYQYQIAG
jgi:tetratricopeptide (TPR) repeat protein